MSKLMFYEVNKDYISFLKQYDPKIPDVEYSGDHNKFLCGVLFELNGRSYFAPISSFAKQQKTNFLIKNRNGRITSSIRFSFMFPAPASQVRVKDFSKEEPKYRRLLQEEYAFCNKNKEKIVNLATYIYHAAISGKDPVIQKNCCNFTEVEKAHDLFLMELSSEKNRPAAEKGRPSISLSDRIAAAEVEAARRNTDRAAPALSDPAKER